VVLGSCRTDKEIDLSMKRKSNGAAKLGGKDRREGAGNNCKRCRRRYRKELGVGGRRSGRQVGFPEVEKMFIRNRGEAVKGERIKRSCGSGRRAVIRLRSSPTDAQAIHDREKDAGREKNGKGHKKKGGTIPSKRLAS